jgi:hypothetical protein
MVILWLYGVLEGPQYRVGRGQKLPYVTEIFCFTSFLVGKVKLVPNILRHNLVPCRKRVDFLCGIGRSSYRMFIAEAHTVTGEDTHGSGGLQVCGPARSLQTGTGSC